MASRSLSPGVRNKRHTVSIRASMSEETIYIAHLMDKIRQLISKAFISLLYYD